MKIVVNTKAVITLFVCIVTLIFIINITFIGHKNKVVVVTQEVLDEHLKNGNSLETLIKEKERIDKELLERKREKERKEREKFEQMKKEKEEEERKIKEMEEARRKKEEEERIEKERKMKEEEERKKKQKAYFYNYTNPPELSGSCVKYDGFTAFDLWVNTNTEEVCKGKDSYHICHKSPLTYPSNRNGAICEFKNAVLDPSQWQDNYNTYNNPWANPSFSKPLVFKGFFNMQCDTSKQPAGYFKEYTEYFDAWNYQETMENDNNIEELAPGKTVFIVKRYPDSNNIFHGMTEVFHAFSIMNIKKLSPDDVVVLFVDSTPYINDPISRFWKQVISHGGEAIYARDLHKTGKKYHITNGIQIPIDWDTPFAPSAGVPRCPKRAAMYHAFYDAVYKYMTIPEFKDKMDYPDYAVRYPKSVTDPTSSQYTKKVTIQWRQPWPRDRKGQQRIMGNGPELMEALAEKVPSNVLVRLVNTAEFTIEEQIGLMKETDYFVGLHGAGFALTIFMPEGAVVHEVLHRSNVNWVIFLAGMSGHPTYSDILRYTSGHDGNEQIYLDIHHFTETVVRHMHENNLL